MKKIYLLLFLLLGAMSRDVLAQTNPCDATFTFTVSGYQVQFVTPTASPTSTQHVWYFGDGNSSAQSMPVHQYVNCGVYTVMHVVTETNPNGVVVCSDSSVNVITIACNPPCNLVANFTWVATSAPNVIFFSPAITGGTATDSIRWNFGDGTVSYSASPTHVYTAAGVYQVCLWVKRNAQSPNTPPCVSEVCYNVTVGSPVPCTLTPTFQYTTTGSNSGQYVFTNTTPNMPANALVTWNFGDNTTGNGNTVSHLYTQSGTYTVCLRVAVSNTCIRDTCITLNVTAAPCVVFPFFSYNQVSNTAPYVVQFSNQSQPANPQALVSWTYGDGTSGSGANPIHTYLQAGSYTVCMTVSYGTNCVRDTCRVIVLGTTPTPCTLQAAYTYTSSGYTYTFTNTSSGYAPGDTLRWTFSNGNITNVQNPVIQFQAPGTYVACLRVKKPTPPGGTPCVSERCDTITVAQVPCTFTPTFSYSNTSVNTLVFTNTTANMPPGNVYVQWNFGDGSTGVGNNQTHVYTQGGTYTVCMRIWLDSTCIRDTCRTITVGNPPCTIQPWFAYTQSSNTAPYVVQFTNQSTPINTQAAVTWNFGDGTTGTGYGVTHTYTQAGTYTVCMTLTYGANCVRDTCRTVVVGLPPVPCTIPMNITVQPAPNATNVVIFSYASPTTNAPQVLWNFGDSTTGVGPVVTHSYAQAGTYTVCVRVTVSNTCFRDTCFVVNIGNAPQPCGLQTSFNWQVIPTSPYVHYFQSTSIGYAPGDTVRWTFSNGYVTNVLNPVVTFPGPGTYTACLRIKKPQTPGAAPCVSELCRVITITPPPTVNCDSMLTRFVYTRDAYMPNKIYFVTVTNTPVAQQTWTIRPLGSTTPLATLNQYNPVYVFGQTGSYQVCMRARLINGCIREHCDTVAITSVSGACVLLPFPNPATSMVSVNAILNAPSTIYAYVYNAQNILVRQRVQVGYVGSNTVSFNVSTLPAGYYTIRLYHNNQMCMARFQKL